MKAPGDPFQIFLKFIIFNPRSFRIDLMKIAICNDFPPLLPFNVTLHSPSQSIVRRDEVPIVDNNSR